ncbi:SDR family NAD(P)-dependent oxidoreductase [Mycobacterium sp. SMC-2]|uniref:SDR family NAD(P)-dependent oxidoreductase n=1 Tax=Mycobacterium sp. SMC-2 TaxID=2857058 RepID=UPI0021B1A304|nr:SDR family NAD(P)-dependent oxidoreductase [Mycobacterium sp. SMC-2]UXA08327.1 SDR family NAD(P)-dependent oxidoreductase [Mycobacterium sp. SMC-2]
MHQRLAGRRALVTGASRGIGAGIAERLAAEGADVAVTARTANEHDHPLAGSLTETRKKIERYGTTIATIVADLTDEEQRDTVVPAAADQLGGSIDILVNNAAAAMYQPVVGYPRKRRRITFEANLFAPIDLANAVIPDMRARGEGWIVNISSATAEPRPGPPFNKTPPGTTTAIYGSSKAALKVWSNALGAELHGDGIRVNAVAPRAAVLSEGAAALVGGMIGPDQIETLEQMVEATLALCDCPEDITGKLFTSLDLLAEWSLEVRGLDALPLP